MSATSLARTVAKRAVFGLAFVLMSPLILTARIGMLFGSTDLFYLGACFAALAPGSFGSYLRAAYYKATLESLSIDVSLGFGMMFSRATARVGKGVAVGCYCILGSVEIEDGVLIASRVSIPSGRNQHADRFSAESPSETVRFERVRIGRESWIGEGAIVLADLGERCIVAAGSVVTRPMPARSVVGGNPARRVGETPLVPSREEEPK